MKKLLIILLLLILVAGGFIFIKMKNDTDKQHKIDTIKAGWYVEITNNYINVRTSPDTHAKKQGQVKKGEIYKVLEVNLSNSYYCWYKIEIDDKTTGWIANGVKSSYLIDHNNPNDIATPTLKFFETEYKVYSIDKINYKHLEITDDKDDYTVSHKVYHEVDASQNIDQYWIVYTVTDASGKSTSKTQKIIFIVKPDESEVIDFALYKK